MFKSMDNIDYNYLKDIEYKIENNMGISKKELDYFLSFIVYSTRMKIMSDNNYYLDFKCDLAQSIICHYLDSLNVKNYPNSTQASIDSYVTGHNFLVATFNIDGRDVNYLIDPTYIQFFKDENCNDSKYIYINGYIITTPDPGYFIASEDMPLISKFNYDGYAVLDEDIARVYGDSFYNTKVMKTSKEFKSMKGYVYINSFLKGNVKPSKSSEELISDGYYLSIENNYVK